MTFQPPTIDEVKKYAIEIGFKTCNPVKWWHFYNSKNWMIGKNKMKSWKSAIWTWFTGTPEWRELQRRKSENKTYEKQQREQHTYYIETASEIKLKEMRKAPEWCFIHWLIDELRPEIK